MYLFIFNVVSAFAWATVLVLTVTDSGRSNVQLSGANAFSNQLGSFLAQYVPATFTSSWSVLAPAQSLALLEIVHVLLGLVRSPLPTTFVQVSSRLALIWGIVARFPSTHGNPIYTTMVLAWSLAEVPRYSYYAITLLGIHPPHWLTWLRYSSFYLLYPLGAGSESLLALSTISEWQNGLYVNWSLEDVFKAVMIVIWIPGLYVMYTHMVHSRRKVLGPQKAQKLGSRQKGSVKTN